MQPISRGWGWTSPKRRGQSGGRHLAAGPTPQWYVKRCARGAGTKAASLAMKSGLSQTTSVVPLRHGRFRR